MNYWGKAPKYKMEINVISDPEDPGIKPLFD